jgi:ATP-binding cassette subfamily F protein 3
MPLLTVNNLRFGHGAEPILDGIAFTLEPGEKVGLVGRNGCGKSTLLKCIAGAIRPDSGVAAISRGGRIGHLVQDPRFEPGDTVRSAAERAFEELHAAHAALEEVFAAMAGPEASDPDGLDRLMKQQVELETRIEALGGYAVDHRVDATLHGLGFADDQFGQSVDTLSGGQKARLGLARLLLEQPDLLLLDEPTNHLDIDGRRWLETFLAEEFPGAVIVVSHDRWLLDRVVSRIIEVEQARLREYPGNYRDFIALRAERMLTQTRNHEKQLDRIRAEEQFIAKYKAGQRAKQARGRESRLQRFKRDELVERPAEQEVMNLLLPKAPRVGDFLLAAEGLSKAFGSRRLFEEVSVTLKPGDRVGIIGPNGAGKTTLVRTMLGELEPDAGELKRSPRLSVGWFRQNQDHLDLSLPVHRYLQNVILSLDGRGTASEQQARNLAGAFLFSGGDQDKVLADLSGGERARAVLAGLVSAAHNLVVLDEPSNHLDIPSAERLEQALVEFGTQSSGALVLISHDRALLEATCDRLVVFDGDGTVTEFPGRYSEWQARQERLDAAAARGGESRPRPADRAATKSPNLPSKRARRSGDSPSADGLESLPMRELEKRIEATEQRIREIDEELMRPSVHADGRRTRELSASRDLAAAELEPLEFEWSRRADAAEA